MNRIRITGLALVAVFALSAGAAASASASEFTAAEYPVTAKAHATKPQGFKISGAVSVCKNASFEGTAAGPSQELTVHPEYKECKVLLEGTEAEATVNTTGCNYTFFDTEKKVNIVCSAGNEIKVTLGGTLKCEIKVPAQTGLKTVEYFNEPAGDVTVHANITGIKYKDNCSLLVVKEGSNGEYREGKFGPLPEMGTGPATALTEGFNSEGKEDAIKA